MTRFGRAIRCIATVFAIFLIAGCAHFTGPSSQFDLQAARWEGRLLVKVRGPTAQSFSAGFLLQGNAQTGQLVLYTPLGTTAAQVDWNPEGARLQANGQTQTFSTLEDLTRQLTGAELPVAHLFAWLQGHDQPAPGWTTDLSQLPQGRLRAQRDDTQAPAELLLVLER